MRGIQLLLGQILHGRRGEERGRGEERAGGVEKGKGRKRKGKFAVALKAVRKLRFVECSKHQTWTPPTVTAFIMTS